MRFIETRLKPMIPYSGSGINEDARSPRESHTSHRTYRRVTTNANGEQVEEQQEEEETVTTSTRTTRRVVRNANGQTVVEIVDDEMYEFTGGADEFNAVMERVDRQFDEFERQRRAEGGRHRPAYDYPHGKTPKQQVDHDRPEFELNYDQFLNDDDSNGPASRAPKHRSSNGLGCKIKGIFDGLGGKDLKSIIKHIKRRRPHPGDALSNFMLSGNMEKQVDGQVRDHHHHFGHIHPDTGRIMGALRGNDLFNFGGLHNNLGNTGKIYLDNLIRGNCRKRKIHKFKPISPELPYAQKAAAEDEEEDAAPTAPAATTKKVAEPAYPTPKSDADAVKTSDYGLDFEQEREKCLKNKTLFEDPEFPASNRSLYYRTPPSRQVVWKRPGEIVPNPQLIVQGESRFDVKQGALGDCWFLAALANITLYDALFYRVVPPNQSFTDDYAGIFHFQFWHYGQWVDVVVDDRLPTVDGQLYYLHSETNNEFWSALVEKAYAKLNGGYENLDGGTTAEALEDFTGGLTEYFDLRKTEKSIVLAALVKGIPMGSLFGCSIDADANIKEAQLRNGLVCGHAYSITALHTVNYRGEDVTLLRLRNPWGEREWNGAWSDDSAEWQNVDAATKKTMNVQFARDGEFYISFDDFFENFTQMECCNLSAEVFDEISEMTDLNVKMGQHNNNEHQWHEVAENGEWSSAKGTAGGCNNNPTTYPNNPQFYTSFTAPQSSVEDDGNVTILVAVLQKYRRELRAKGKDLLPIGVSIYKSEAHRRLDNNFFNYNRPVARTQVFVNTREVTIDFRVPPGDYIIVPCTFDAYDDGDFLLRVYTNGGVQSDLL